MNSEDQRYAAVNAQIKQLLDDGVNDTNPATAIMRAMLVAELYDRNERTHMRALEKQAQEPEE